MLNPNRAGSPFGGSMLKTSALIGTGDGWPSTEPVIWLWPTFVVGGQLLGLASPVAVGHCGVACGLTLSPTGRSTWTVFSSPIGSSGPPTGSGITDGLFRTMNWVKPTCGWPAAFSKNWPGVATEQTGVSVVQVPACQPLVGV